MLGVKRNAVVCVAHDEAWDNEFRATKEELEHILGDNAVEVLHIGSTAIKGIVAKPILDVAVVIKSADALNLPGMEAAGYEYLGEHGGAGRYLFVWRMEGEISTHHIHCYLENHENLADTVLFCRYLNENPEWAGRYNDLKIELATRYAEDRAAYTEGKAGFIVKVIAMAKAAEVRK